LLATMYDVSPTPLKLSFSYTLVGKNV